MKIPRETKENARRKTATRMNGGAIVIVTTRRKRKTRRKKDAAKTRGTGRTSTAKKVAKPRRTELEKMTRTKGIRRAKRSLERTETNLKNIRKRRRSARSPGNGKEAETRVEISPVKKPSQAQYSTLM